MSPRSGEFIDQARDRVAAAREALTGGHYEAITPELDKAEEIVTGAGDFVTAVERMLGGDSAVGA